MQYGGNRTRDSELHRVKDVRESNPRDPGLQRVKDVMFVDNLWCLFVVCKQVCMLCIPCVHSTPIGRGFVGRDIIDPPNNLYSQYCTVLYFLRKLRTFYVYYFVFYKRVLKMTVRKLYEGI